MRYMAALPWLLLAHQLPTRPSNARVKTWRRLQHIGSVPVRNSVYALPNTEECREDFAWIRSEIVALGGEATLFAAEALDAGSEDLVAIFQRARDADYRALKKEADRMLSASRATRRSPAANREEWGRSIGRLRERFNDIDRTDFFRAPSGREALSSVTALERLAAGPADVVTAQEPILARAAYRRRRWVTRPRPGVDRMASAW